MPTSQSIISSTRIPLLANGVFTSKAEDILNYTGADISLFSDQPCLIAIYGGPTQTGPWTKVFDSGVTTANVGYSATYLTFYPYSYLTVTNQTATNQTVLQVVHILRVHSHIMETTGNSSIVGDVNVLNFPATQAVSGSVDVGNFPATQAVSGSVDVGNFPATQAVSGSVDVGNFPVTQAVSGSVDVGNFPATQAVSGSVDVGNFPATQAVSGTVDVGNFPATQAVSGSVDVGNFPATQAVSGSVDVGNFPATQAVSGSVDVGNFPATQDVQLTTVSGVAITLGQKAMAGSLPVVISSDQSVLAVNDSYLSSITYSGLSLNTYDTNLATCISGGLVNVNPQVAQSGTIVWSDGSAPINYGLSKEYPFQGIPVGAQGRRRVCIYGSVIALDGPLTLTIVYSQTGVYGTWHNSSNGILSFTEAGDFSRDFETSAPYVSAYINSFATANIIISAI